jgi:D-arabinose 1-dehydrogenase-like Zn-dependent alcohol dehydrogenase
VLAKEFPSAKSVVLGHEFSGVVTEIGKEVKHCSVGERLGWKNSLYNYNNILICVPPGNNI